MSGLSPQHCRPEAFHLFTDQLPSIDETESLLMAAIAISIHALDDVDPADVVARIDSLAQRVRARASSRRPPALHAHLHEILFNEEGFQGNSAQYYSPLNSYLPAVLEVKRGNPITLVLLYKGIAERVGLPVEGINSPGHFLARVTAGPDTMLIDPFYHGQVLTHDEARQRIETIIGQRFPDGDTYFAPATHRQWLARMLHNLQQIFSASQSECDLAAMNELLDLLDESGC